MDIGNIILLYNICIYQSDIIILYVFLQFYFINM